MPFEYTTRMTTGPYEIDDWFASFEAWVTGVGWAVDSGAGTDDLVIRSESVDLTVFAIRVWRVPGTDVVRLTTSLPDDVLLRFVSPDPDDQALLAWYMAQMSQIKNDAPGNI